MRPFEEGTASAGTQLVASPQQSWPTRPAGAHEQRRSHRPYTKLIVVNNQAISDYRRGKDCGLKKRIQIAEITGVDRVRTIFEYFADSLDETDDFESEAKRVMTSILDSFPRKPTKPQKPKNPWEH